MDSLPTGSTQSWFIVAAVAFSPVMSCASPMPLDGSSVKQGGKGRNYRQSRRKRGPPMSSVRTGAVGTVIGAFVPSSPVVAFLIVIAAAGRARR